MSPLYSTAFALDAAQRYAESNMTATVRVSRLADPTLDTNTGILSADPAGDTVYEGAGRVWTVAGPLTMGIGDELSTFSSTFVSIPMSADLPHVDDLVEITAHSDPTMVGRAYRVMDVEAGSQIPAARKMQVQGIQSSPEWS